jgi:hypothetical protein
VGIAVAAVMGFGWATRHQASPAPSPPKLGPVVYGEQVLASRNGGFYRAADNLTCTAEVMNVRFGAWVCTSVAIVQPGQIARTAADPGGPCSLRHADQASGRWVCDHVRLTDQNLVPDPPTATRPASPSI